LPKAAFEMYSKAKQKAYADLETTTSLKVTLPWVTQEFEDTRKLMGENYTALTQSYYRHMFDICR